MRGGKSAKAKEGRCVVGQQDHPAGVAGAGHRGGDSCGKAAGASAVEGLDGAVSDGVVGAAGEVWVGWWWVILVG